MEAPFLRSAKEAEEYQRQWQPRKVVQFRNAKWPFIRPEPKDLEDMVRRVVQRIQAEPTARAAIGVAVEIRDGLSWSATKARELVEAGIGPKWEVRCVCHHAGRDDAAVQQLLDLLGGKRAKRHVRRAAGSSLLVPELHRPWAWWFGGLLVMILAGAGTAALTEASTGDATPLLWASLAVAPVLALIARIFTPQFVPIAPTEANRKVQAALREDPQTTEEEDEFIRLLIARLSPRQHRVTIVENLGELAPRTRMLIETHLEHSRRSEVKDVWLLFARGRRRGSTARATAVGQQPGAPALVTLRLGAGMDQWNCYQAPFAMPEKTGLLQMRDKREPQHGDVRLRQRSVGHVVAGVELMEGEASDIDITGELKGLTLTELHAFALTAAAAAVPDPAALHPEDLANLARASRGDDLLRRLFVEWFPKGSHSQAAIKQALVTVREEASALLEDPGDDGIRTLRVIQVYADAFRAKEVWSGYELPDQDLAHAFWALYWQKELGHAWSAPVADRLVAHLRLLEEPAMLRISYGNELADRLFTATIDAVEAALALCVGGLAPQFGGAKEPRWISGPGLLEQARLLLAVEDGAPDQSSTERLRTLAWLVYMITGEPDLIETISSLNDDLTDEGERAGGDPLLELYVEVVPGYEGAPPLPKAGESGIQAAVVDHARARAAWLASIMALASWVAYPSMIAESGAAATAELPRITERAIRRLGEEEDDDTATLDQLTLVHILLCDALIVLLRDPGVAEEAEKRREDVTTLTAARIARRERSGRRTHYVLDGMLRQVEKTAHACACVAAALEDGDSTPLGEALMTLEGLHVTWLNMELYELADLAALTHAALGILGDPDERGHADGERLSHLVGISAGEAAGMHSVAADTLLGLVRVRRNATLAGMPLAKAASVAIESHLGPSLALSLCLTVMGLPNNPDRVQVERLTEFALEPHGGRPGMLDSAESQFLRSVMIVLRNVVSNTSPVAVKAIAAIQRRNESIESPWLKDRVVQQVEQCAAYYGDVPKDPAGLSELLERWRDRAWSGHLPGLTSVPQARPQSYLTETVPDYAFELSYLWAVIPKPPRALLDDSVRFLAERGKYKERGDVVLAVRVAQYLEHSIRAEAQVPQLVGVTSAHDELEGGTGRPTASTSTGNSEVSFTAGKRAAVGESKLSDERAFTLALRILGEGIGAEARKLWPATNRTIYLLLARYDASRADEHRAKADLWRTEGERIAQEPMFLDAGRGRYFEVFWHHFTRLPELPLDRPRDELKAILDGSLQELWDTSRPTPEPILYQNDGTPVGISTDFLRAGHFLMHRAGQPDTQDRQEQSASEAPPQRRPIDEEDELALNEVARERVPDLYRILIERSQIPESLRELFQMQQTRFAAQ
jgi:hypothetical protein